MTQEELDRVNDDIERLEQEELAQRESYDGAMTNLRERCEAFLESGSLDDLKFGSFDRDYAMARYYERELGKVRRRLERLYGRFEG